MKTLYLECNMGAAGDMLAAALYELVDDKEGFLQKMNSLGLPGVTVRAEPAEKCGIHGTHVSVTVGGVEEESSDVHSHPHSHDAPGSEHGEHSHEHGHIHQHDHEHAHGHHHSGMHDIEHIIRGHLDLPDSVKDNAMAVYGLIAEAESHAHGAPVDQIHFHEVGTLDAVADVVGVCLLLDMIRPDRIVASPIHVGCGEVHCAHGVLPVPAPATAYILQGVPTFGGAVRGELCTPTGAAVLKHFVSRFGEMPVMRVEKIGYGMGKKDFERANCVRAMLGETEDTGDRIVELACNLDDMTPEAIGFAQERLFEAGALDVYTTPIGMKKCRPGVLFTCMCKEENKETMVRLIFRHTSTLGIRESVCNRYTLARSQHTRETPYGSVRIKIAEGWGTKREKAEFEDLAAIARAQDISLHDILKGPANPDPSK